MKIVHQQAEITKNILDHAFFSPGNFVFQGVRSGSEFRAPLNCAGCFNWNPLFTSTHAMLTIFPIFFDYLDLYVEDKLNICGTGFKSKKESLEVLSNNEDIESIFIYELYSLAADLRNKILHHDFDRTNDTLTFAKRTLNISNVRILNEIIYQYVRFGVTNKSWYEQNALYSHLNTILGRHESKLTKILTKNENFVALNGVQHYALLHDSKYLRKKEPSHRIFDYCCLTVGSCNGDEAFLKAHPDPNFEFVSSRQFYVHKMEDDLFVFPSDLIIQKPDTRFSDLMAWKYTVSFPPSTL